MPGWHPEPASQVSVPLQNSPSSHVSGVPDWQLPVWHVSSPLQRSASAQGVSFVTIGWVQVPPALHSSSVQTSPSSVHAVPGESSWHLDEQQSPSSAFPSSQFSPCSIVEFPHRSPLEPVAPTSLTAKKSLQVGVSHSCHARP